MHNVASIVKNTAGRKLVVLSALSGTTNMLVKINELCKEFRQNEAHEQAVALKVRHEQFVAEILKTKEAQEIAHQYITEVFDYIDSLIRTTFSDQIIKLLVVQGELLSTKIFFLLLKELQLSTELLMAQDFMVLDQNHEPNFTLTKKKYEASIAGLNVEILITQGFIARNHHGGIDNLERGGSDYSATILGAVSAAEEIQIWTDIDGMHNNDPRVVDHTQPLAQLSFEEASELAYFGAKVLHPQCIVPAHLHQIPVRIKNTMKPEAHGTLISEETNSNVVKALAAKDGITAIKIKSSRMVMAYGFLRRVFEIFERYETSIDMITTSEIAVSLTIDDDSNLLPIKREIEKYGRVEVDTGQSIICIVGDLIAERKGVGKQIFTALDEIPIRMISYGGSKNNISLLVAEEYKDLALRKLHATLF